MGGKKSSKPGAAKYPTNSKFQVKSAMNAMNQFRKMIPRTTKNK